MEFKWHLLIGFVFSYILVFFFDFSYIFGIILFLASFLLDLDHYFWYAYSFRDWNPLRAIKWYRKTHPKWKSLKVSERKKFQKGLFILHNLILIFLIGILSLISEIFLAILFGVLIHIAADLIAQLCYQEPLYVKIFPWLVIRKNKNKKSLANL